MRRWLKLKRRGVKRPRMVIAEAKRAGLSLPHALAVLEKETGIPQRNIFGCDHGPGRAFCHEKVTKERVRKLLASGAANGVGWTQLTYIPFVIEAQKLGGAHKPRYQMRVGFRVLRENIQREGSVWAGFRAYNGTGPAASAYADEAVALAKKWRRILR